MSKKSFLEIGRIVRTHGIKGDVKIVPWCDDPLIVTGLSHLFFDCEGRSLKHIESARILKNAVIVKFLEIDSIECAQEIVGRIVYVNRNDIVLSDGVYFVQDLIGMHVYDVDDKNTYYGKVVDVLQPGANDVYRIVDDNNIERLIPVIDDVVIDIELDDNIIYIRPLEGLFYD